MFSLLYMKISLFNVLTGGRFFHLYVLERGAVRARPFGLVVAFHAYEHLFLLPSSSIYTICKYTLIDEFMVSTTVLKSNLPLQYLCEYVIKPFSTVSSTANAE